MGGFYGTTTSSAKTNLTFDKTYPNRATMDQECKNGDGVYAGRYVLVEYGINNSPKAFYFRVEDEKPYKFYNALPINSATEITKFEEKALYGVYVVDSKNVTDYPTTYELHIGLKTGDTVNLQRVSTGISGNIDYAGNYLVDKKIYGGGETFETPSSFRGYDSTVWQKTYNNDGTAQYVMIAELNSIVPTFNIKVDAPSEKPIAPHFDVNNTNVYYDLHLQPSWGFRVAKAADTDPSDENYTYEGDTTSSRAAIYFNKKGFEEYTKNTQNNGENYITVKPTGESGTEYISSHDLGNFSKEKQPDIQEMRINLPAIGNVIADAWDIIHGPDRDDDVGKSLQGRLDFFTSELKENEVPLQSNGKYLVGAVPQGDTWIDVAVNASAKTISIAHKTPNSITSLAGTESAQTPGFGKTFNIPHVKYDSRGHIYSSGSTTVTIPEVKVDTPSTSTNNASVLTGLGWDATNDKITFSKQDAGSLLLTGYTIASAAKSIQSTDSINTAFGKLQKSLNEENLRAENEESALNKRIDDLDYSNTSTTQFITGITQTNGLINVSRADAGTLVLGSGYKKASATGVLSTADTINSALGQLEYNLESEASRLDKRINDLDVTDSGTGYNVATAITQTDGKINPVHTDISELKLNSTFSINGVSEGGIAANDTINTAFAKAQVGINKINDYISGLDYSNTSTTQFITKISQTDGQIEVERAAAGTLVLGDDYTSPHGKIAKTDSLNSAFNKVETEFNTLDTKVNTEVDNLNSRIDTEVDNLTDKINLLFNDEDSGDLDSVIDLINWVGDHGEEVTEIKKDITDNGNAITTLNQDLLDLKDYIDTREITVTSEQGEILLGTIETVLGGILTRVKALEEMCQIYPMDNTTSSEGGEEGVEESGDGDVEVPTVPDFDTGETV